MNFSVSLSSFRQTLSDEIFSAQEFLMEHYGSFDEQGNFTATRPVPLWVNQTFRAMGQLALFVKSK